MNILKSRPTSRHSKKKGQMQIKMCDNNGNPFIATLHNVLLEPDLCDGLFFIIIIMNLGPTFSFHKGFFNVYFGSKYEKFGYFAT